MTNLKPIISPGQGILLLIKHYKNDLDKVDRLKKWYLCGAESSDDTKEIEDLLNDSALSQYTISYDSQTINNDPARRYFETHLAYESLKNGLNKIKKEDLEYHFDELKKMIPETIFTQFKEVLDGKFDDEDKEIFKEYADYIEKIKSKKMFINLSADDRDKIELLVKCSFLGVLNAKYNKLPLDIYDTGIYSEENKGKVLVKNQETTRNHNLGIMKGHMPLALDDIARSDTEIPYLKPSDQSSYIEHALWVKTNFNKLVHPFSNSISGTMLCQLRVHAQLKNDKKGVFTDSAEQMEHYSQLMISAMLFNSGGHSLNEFTAPLSLKEVRTEFSSIDGFEKINLESMYFTKNKKSFDTALESTIEYNKTILLRNNLHAQLKKNIGNNAALKKLKLTHELNSLSGLVTAKKENYDQRINAQWFSYFRSGKSKNKCIQQGLTETINHLNNGKLERAKETISELKKEIESKFGKSNFWGQKSESFKIVENLDSALNNALCFKERLYGIKTQDLGGTIIPQIK